MLCDLFKGFELEFGKGQQTPHVVSTIWLQSYPKFSLVSHGRDYEEGSRIPSGQKLNAGLRDFC